MTEIVRRAPVDGGRPVRPIRVVQLVWSLAPGGIERLVVDIARRLDPERFVTEVIYMHDAGGPSFLGELEAAGVAVHRVPKERTIDPAALVRLASCLRRRRPDLLQSHDFGPNAWGRLAGLLARVPVLLATEHLPPESQPKSRLRVAVDRCLAPHTRYLIAVSHRIRDTFVHRERIDPERILYLPNGVDVERFHPGPGDEEARRELGHDDGAIVALSVGGLHPRKGQETLLRALSLIGERDPRLRATLVGDGELRADLNELARKLGVADRVRFLGYRCDVPRLLRAADVFVQTSRSESCSLALLEAMASGMPIVATPVGDNPEILAGELSDQLISIGDARALAEALLRLAADEGRRKQVGERARRRVLEQHDLRDYLERLAALYEALAREARCVGFTSAPTSSA